MSLDDLVYGPAWRMYVSREARVEDLLQKMTWVTRVSETETLP